jgi:hypothetical protein
VVDSHVIIQVEVVGLVEKFCPTSGRLVLKAGKFRQIFYPEGKKLFYSSFP